MRVYSLGKISLANEFWETLRVRLTFHEDLSTHQDQALIQGVWEILSKHDVRIIHKGVYAFNTIRDFLDFTERMCRFMVNIELVPRHKPFGLRLVNFYVCLGKKIGSNTQTMVCSVVCGCMLSSV